MPPSECCSKAEDKATSMTGAGADDDDDTADTDAAVSSAGGGNEDVGERRKPIALGRLMMVAWRKCCAMCLAFAFAWWSSSCIHSIVVGIVCNWRLWVAVLPIYILMIIFSISQSKGLEDIESVAVTMRRYGTASGEKTPIELTLTFLPVEKIRLPSHKYATVCYTS